MKKTFPIIIALLLLCLGGCAITSQQENPQPEPNSENDTSPTEPEQQVTEPTDGSEPPSPVTPVDPLPSGNQVIYDENGTYPAALMYHLIMETPYNDYEALFVRPSTFEEELSALNEAGYSYLFANDYNKTAGKSVIITFDDGYEDNYTTMFPILKQYNARATVFLISDMIDTPGYMTTAQIKEMAQSGYVFFGCHTASHCDLSKQSAERIREEFARSIEKIESITGQKCDALAYPSGGYNDTVTEIAKEYFKFAYLARPTVKDGVQTDMKVPRYYVARSLSAASFMKMIGN